MFSRFSQVVPVVPAVGSEAPISLDLWRGFSAKLKRSSTLSRDVANDCNKCNLYELTSSSYY